MDNVRSMFLISFGFHNPFNQIALLLGGVNIVLTIVYVVKLIVKRHSDTIRNMDNGINIILFLSLCMILSAFSQTFHGIYKAVNSVATRGTDDPVVMFQGVMESITPFMYIGFVCSFNMVCWFLLRAFHRLQLKKQITE